MCVLQGISLLQEQLTSFSKSSGARGCHWEELFEKSFGSIFQRPSKCWWMHSRRTWLQTIPSECHLKVRRAPFHWMRHLLKADKPVLVHRHTLAYCLHPFSGVPWQWPTFSLTITCLALVTSSWTHQRWPPYAYLSLHWPTMRRFWMSTRRPSTHNARPKRTEGTSHEYSSKQNDRCCLHRDRGQNATCGAFVA